MKIHSHKFFIPCVPFPAEWTVRTASADQDIALKKCIGEIKIHGLKPCSMKIVREDMLYEYLGERDTYHNA